MVGDALLSFLWNVVEIFVKLGAGGKALSYFASAQIICILLYVVLKSLQNTIFGEFMKCPYCGGLRSKVIDSRSLGEGVRRRRQCLACAARFTTYERVQSRNIFVIKKDHRREAFDLNKLSSGIRKACEKRPLPAGAVDKLIDSVEAKIYRLGKTEVPSSLIGDLVMEELKKLDHIAYIRFASVYREFADIGDLKQEIDNLAADRAVIQANQLPLLPSEAVSSSAGHQGDESV